MIQVFGWLALLVKIATAIVNLAIDLTTGMLVGGVAKRSIPKADRRSCDFTCRRREESTAK